MKSELSEPHKNLKWDIRSVTSAAVQNVSIPTLDLLAAALPTYHEIATVINASSDSNDEVWTGGAVETAVRREAAAQDGWLQPRAWLTQQVALRVALVDIALRTSPPAIQPLEDLLDRAAASGAPRDDGLRTALVQIFLNSLERSTHTVDRIDVLPWRFAWDHATSDLWSLDPKEQVNGQTVEDIREQLANYLELWRSVIERTSRPPKTQHSLPLLLDDVSTLEDGFLVRAQHAAADKQQRYAERFADAAIAIIEGATT